MTHFLLNTIFLLSLIINHVSSVQNLTLKLHPYHPLVNSSKTAYTARIRAQIRGDIARMEYLNAKLFPKHAKVSSARSFLDSYESQITSGYMDHGFSQYITAIGVGTPPKNYFLTVDTGSDLTWLQCEPCQSCYTQIDHPIYDTSLSSSSRYILYDEDKCQMLEHKEPSTNTPEQLCMYGYGYVDRSVTVGNFIEETLTMGGEAIQNIGIGCGHYNEGRFKVSAGALGIGGGPLSLLKQTHSRWVSYCLRDKFSEKPSTLRINEVSLPMPGEITVPLIQTVQNPTFFYVGLTGISTDNNKLEIPESAFELNHDNGKGGVILDTGTVVTSFGGDVYTIFRDKFVELADDLSTPYSRQQDGDVFDTCYDVSILKFYYRVPTVALHFGEEQTLTLPPENVLFPVDYGFGTFCLAFKAGTLGSTSVIGNIQQQGMRVGIDLLDKTITLLQNNCAE